MTFAYLLNCLDHSSEDQLTIADLIGRPKSCTQPIINVLVSVSYPNLHINCLSNWQLSKSFLDFQEKIPPCSLKDQSSAKTAVGSEGIFTSESPQSGPSGSDSLEEVCSTLRANLDRVFELSSMTQKEALHMRS